MRSGAMHKPSNHKSSFAAKIDWVLDKLSALWPFMTAITITGLSGWAASATEVFQHNAPFSWIFCGLLSGAIFVFLYLCWQLALRYKTERGVLEDYQREKDNINPLDTFFEKKRIDIMSLKPPLLEPIKNKTFSNCEICGPAIIYFMGASTIQDNTFKMCDFVKIKNTAAITNVIIFDDVTIKQCNFYNLTILVPESIVGKFPKGANWITL